MDINCVWLEENFFKHPLTSEQKQLVCSRFESITYYTGDTIVTQGEASHAVYIVYSGAAYIDCDNNGETVRIGTAKSGDLVGEMSFVSESTASATVTAREDCLVYKLSRNAFSEMRREDSELVSLTFTTLLMHTSEIVRHMNAEKAAVQHYLAGSHF